MEHRILAALLLLTGWGGCAQAQDLVVPLTQRTPLDGGGHHVEPLRATPAEALRLPEVDLTDAAYLGIYYSRALDDDVHASILVLPAQAGQTLYIDRNNDEDLTNDGPPLFFPFADNEIVFYLYPDANPEQRTGRVLQRIPDHVVGDSAATAHLFDADGNLRPQWVGTWRAQYPAFDGTKGTFFFDDYVDLSRGTVVLGGTAYAIGLNDYNQNGVFGDRVEGQHSDLLYIDRDRDGRLRALDWVRLDEVFEIGGQAYRLVSADPQGRSLTLAPTTDVPTR